MRLESQHGSGRWSASPVEAHGQLACVGLPGDCRVMAGQARGNRRGDCLFELLVLRTRNLMTPLERKRKRARMRMRALRSDPSTRPALLKYQREYCRKRRKELGERGR